MLHTHAVTADSDHSSNPAAPAAARNAASEHPLAALHRSVGNRALARTLQRTCACGGSGGSCDCDRDGLHRSANGPAPDTAPSIVHDVLGSPGGPLEEGAREAMESHFGLDFRDVVVHHGAAAAASARAVGANAYTVGRHVVFGDQAYQPATPQGQRLLAHELTHVAQQSGGPDSVDASLEVGAPDTDAEREADSVASSL